MEFRHMTESMHDWHAEKPSGSNLHGKSENQWMEFRHRTESNPHIISMLGNQAGLICIVNLKNNGWNLGAGLNPHIIGMLRNQAGAICMVNLKKNGWYLDT
jgi:hypothetical protein